MITNETVLAGIATLDDTAGAVAATMDAELRGGAVETDVNHATVEQRMSYDDVDAARDALALAKVATSCLDTPEIDGTPREREEARQYSGLALHAAARWSCAAVEVAAYWCLGDEGAMYRLAARLHVLAATALPWGHTFAASYVDDATVIDALDTADELVNELAGALELIIEAAEAEAEANEEHECGECDGRGIISRSRRDPADFVDCRECGGTGTVCGE